MHVVYFAYELGYFELLAQVRFAYRVVTTDDNGAITHTCMTREEMESDKQHI